MPNPPKPTERKRRSGNPGKRPLPVPRSVVSALERAPAPPQGLGKAGLVVWRRVWDAGSDWLAPGDVTILEMLCRQVDEITRWQEILDAEGVTFTTRNGFIRVHPAVAPDPRARAARRHQPRAVRLHASRPGTSRPDGGPQALRAGRAGGKEGRCDRQGSFVIEFIERHCRITKGKAAGQLVKLVAVAEGPHQRPVRARAGVRRYRRAYVQMAAEERQDVPDGLRRRVRGRLRRARRRDLLRRRRPDAGVAGPSGRSARSSRPTPSSAACSRSTSTRPRSRPPARSSGCCRPTPACSSGSSRPSSCSTRSPYSRTTACGTRCRSARVRGRSR